MTDRVPVYLTFQSTSNTDDAAMHHHGIEERFTVGPFDHVDLDWGTLTVVPMGSEDQVCIAEHTRACANMDGRPDLCGWRFVQEACGLLAMNVHDGWRGLTFTRCYISTGHTS